MAEESENPGAQFLERKLATILSADVAEFSRLMGENEEQTLKTFRGHRQVFESLVAMHRGRIFNTAGDAILAEFASAVEAVRCATDIQAALRTRNDPLPLSRQVRFRMGINLGDVMVHGQDLLGDGVNVASRLQTAAEPGGICISGSVLDQIRNKLSLSFHSLGEMNFKNIQQPVRTFSITEAESGIVLPSPPYPRVEERRGKWIAGGLLLLAVVAYGTYAVNERRQASTPPPVAAVSHPEVTRPEVTPLLTAPQASVPRSLPAEVPPQTVKDKVRAVAVPPATNANPYDGVYSGPVCYGRTASEPERCYAATGTITGRKIAGQWTMGRENANTLSLTGDVTASGKVLMEIQSHRADGSRLATIDLTGSVRDGLITATGSFRNGRPATLNWRNNTPTSR
jgi:class 3 adenylate cyclase